jgi:hypothetical protein
MTNTRQQIASQLRHLAGDRVKSLVLSWLAETDGSLTDLEQMIEAETHEVDLEALTYGELGELEEGLNFQPLTEADMVEKSLEALEKYRRTGQGIIQADMREWVDSLGTDYESPCPQ